ncbi:phospholipase [Planktothricoides sp. SR001]|uniref:alpha/beta hydrolase n=1 Tax=Planktothricoides sp. SR001 TaxID=1705388 RepID=UPI0006BF4824|nr:alpha/beta fold hydrolase [Planktothricoides sp. SR001]KOR38573.1 phospholipase [Planktothricoides sp. SR001]
MQFWVKILVALGTLLAVLYLSACLFLFVRQNRFIFFPSREISTIPSDLQMDYQEVWLPVISEENQSASTTEKVHGWWIPAAAENRSPMKSEWVLLFLHGNADNISENLKHSNRFHQLGFSVFMVDYRGYGLSQGKFPTESTVYEDVETAWNYLVNQRGIPPEKIVIYGHSLGGAIAIDLASRKPNAAGAIIEASFTSMRDMVDYQYPHFNIFPIDWILTHRFDSISKVKDLKMPILFTHGTADETVPTSMSQELFDAANEPKKLFIVPTADHNNIARVSGEKYFETIREFMKLVDYN